MSRTNPKTKPYLVAAILIAGLTASCGQNAATAEDDTGNAADALALAATTAAPDDAEVAGTAASTAATETEAAMTSPSSAQDKAATASVGSLPLKPGHYVRPGTPCNQASRADTVALVSRTGMSLNCTFKKIEKTGSTTYRVTSECSDGGAAWGREDSIETMTDIYEIPNDTSFTVKYEGGSENSGRYCAQVNG